MRTAMRLEEDRQAAASELAAALAMDSDGGISAAAQGWLLANNVSVTSNAYWAPDDAHMNAARELRPWREDENFFKRVKISAIAAVKMLIHAKRGMPQGTRENWFEVMGLMTGHFRDDTMYVTDSFGLPVDASEVECSMNEGSMIYQAEYLNYHWRVGKPDRGCIGWYHSHPGYTCFLSGVDVNTQQLNQTNQDPWVAVVVDPVGTIASGRMDLKAFRTYTEDYVKEKDDGDKLSHAVVKQKGLHAHKYYELPITIIRSQTDAVQLDAILAQYWALTFSTNPLIANREFHTGRLMEVAGATAAACGCGDGNPSSKGAGRQVRWTGKRRVNQTGGAGFTARGIGGGSGAGANSSAAAAGASSSASVESVYESTWGPYQRTTGTITEMGLPADLTDVEVLESVRAVQQSADLVTEVLLGGVPLSLKNTVFGSVPSTHEARSSGPCAES